MSDFDIEKVRALRDFSSFFLSLADLISRLTSSLRSSRGPQGSLLLHQTRREGRNRRKVRLVSSSSFLLELTPYLLRFKDWCWKVFPSSGTLPNRRAVRRADHHRWPRHLHRRTRAASKEARRHSSRGFALRRNRSRKPRPCRREGRRFSQRLTSPCRPRSARRCFA